MQHPPPLAAENVAMGHVFEFCAARAPCKEALAAQGFFRVWEYAAKSDKGPMRKEAQEGPHMPPCISRERCYNRY